MEYRFDRPFFSCLSLVLPPPFFQPRSHTHTAIAMDSKAEGQRQTMLEKARRKIYEESERERQKIAKVTHRFAAKIVLDSLTQLLYSKMKCEWAATSSSPPRTTLSLNSRAARSA